MRISLRYALLLSALSLTVAGNASTAQVASSQSNSAPPPLWAFFAPDAEQPPAKPPQSEPQSLPGSTRQYTTAQINDLKNPPDWFPNEHSSMPTVVARGGEGKVFACASCHLTSGMGHPQSSPLAGKPIAYSIRQIAEFKTGARRNPIVVDGKPVMNAPEFMTAIAKDMTDEQAKEAAIWFAQLKTRPWIKVVETGTVPATYITRSFSRAMRPSGGTEPLGSRIIELPQDAARVAARDPRIGFVAHVPVGSIGRGRVLVTNGGGKTLPCSTCHGADLKGMADVPGIAGVSPTYVFRQLYGFKDGSRNGAMAVLMKDVVKNLSDDEMIDIAAYMASLQ